MEMRALHQIRMSQCMLILLVKGLQARNILHNVYATSVILEEELSSAEMHAAVDNNNGKLQTAFNNFQNILKIFANKKCVLDLNDKLL